MAEARAEAAGASRALLFTNARLVDPAAREEQRGGVLVANGLIAESGPHLAATPALRSVREDTRVIDCRGLVLTPGLVDLQAFVGEPGAEHRETFASASRAAAVGGITTLICRPDTDPAIDDPAIVDFVLRRARAASPLRIHPCAALTKGLAGREMTEIGLLKEAGAVAFGDGHKSVMNAQLMRRAMLYARDRDAIVSHFTQDANLAAEGVMNEGEFASRLGLPAIPKAAETMILMRDLALVRLTRVRYHAALISCAKSVEAIREAKAQGLAVTCAVSVNHLTLNESDVGDYRTFFKVPRPCAPKRIARRSSPAWRKVWSTSSCPITIRRTSRRSDSPWPNWPTARSGSRRCSPRPCVSSIRVRSPPPRLLAAMSSGPAAAFRLPDASLAPGARADLIVLDPDEPWVVDPANLASLCKNTPFDEARLQGRVLATLVGGEIIHAVAGSLPGL